MVANTGAAPLPVQLLVALLGPWVIAGWWRLMARGWAMGMQRGAVSERTRRRQRVEFWVLLWACYGIVFLIFGAAWLGFRP